MEIRPDFSPYVAHFTKDEWQLNARVRTARDRLAKILADKHVQSSRMPWFGAYAAAFTECTWTSLLAHAGRYSPYGIGFSKQFLWNNTGGPVMYLRVPTLYDAQADYVTGIAGRDTLPFADAVRNFLTPIAFEPFTLRSGQQVPTHVDYSHEREWRVPPPGLRFEYSDVQFVIVNDSDDLAALPSAAVDVIGKASFLSMSNYRRIEELWPTLHIQR